MVTPDRNGDRGMTLVEIMVTMIISSIIAASTFMFFAGQQRIYDTQTKVLSLQQNLWAAMEVVSRYARASGSGMYECVQPATYYNSVDNGSRLLSGDPDDRPLSFLPTEGQATWGLAHRPATGARAYDSTTNTAQWIPPLWIVDNASGTAAAEVALQIKPDTDVFTVAFGDRTSGTDVDGMLALNVPDTAPGTTISLIGPAAGDMFRQWEFILLLVTPNWGFGNDPVPDRGCTLLQITADPRLGTVLDHASNTPESADARAWNPPGKVDAMLPTIAGYTVNTGTTRAGVRNFGRLTWARFFIQQRDATAIPNLMMQRLHARPSTGTPDPQNPAPGDPEVLAEGIEDLQVAFACDTGDINAHNLIPNGVLDEGNTDATRRTDEWWNNVPSDTLPAKGTPGYCNLPTAVRITLVARTLAPDDLIDVTTGNGPLNIENHRYDNPVPDQYRRRVLSTTVYPRNNKPL